MTGRHAAGRLPRWVAVLGLAVALIAAGRVLTLPQPDPAANPASEAAAREPSVPDVWPNARIIRSAGRLADDRAYTPSYHLDSDVSVGTALTGDGTAIRLLLRGADGVAKELMRLPSTDNPQFNALTAAGDDLLWMVSDGAAEAKSTLYRADWRQGGPAVALTADTGDVIYYNSQYDVVVADGQARWAAARPDEEVTELRSIPVRGGPVTVQRIEGTFSMSAWPWLSTAGSSQSGPVELHNLATGERITVPGGPTDVVTCGPTWCRVMVLDQTGQPVRTDLMRPDGSGRVRVAAGRITASVLDVALLDRFEVLSATGSGDGATNLKLILYDLRSNRSSVLANGVATVHARGPVVWWSTGDDEAVTWYALDLRTLG